MNEYLYRYVDVAYSLGCDEYDNPYPGYNLKVELKKFKIIKRTPKGAWLAFYDGLFLEDSKKFVLLSARKKYACETKELALESFVARKRRQVRILGSCIKRAETALFIASCMERRSG